VGWKSWYWTLSFKFWKFQANTFRSLSNALSDTDSNQMPSPAPNPAYVHSIQFERHVLAGCGHDGSTRTYDWNPDGDAFAELKNHMDHLKEVRIGYNAELQHMFRILARKERSFYAMTSEDDAKDDLRRQRRSTTPAPTSS
jgi:hypothetical protein